MSNADALLSLDADLRGVFGGRLRSFLTYGAGHTHDGLAATLAIVDTVSAPDLRACAARVAGWRARGLATPLVLEADEFERSLDAFPFEFGAILADYTVVSGADPLHGLAIDPADLRRACEVQARSHLLHLREGYIETEGRSDRIAELIVRSAAPLAALRRHVARLSRAPVTNGVLARVAELAANGTLSSDEADRLFAPYLDAVDRLVNDLDRWSVA
jgi:hypothetical protein